MRSISFSMRERLPFKATTTILGLVALVLGSCAPHGPAHYRANGVYQTFDFSSSNKYRDYQVALRKDLTGNWQDLFATDKNYAGEDPTRASIIVEHLMPTDRVPVNHAETSGRKRSMLLIHGLYDSPYGMHDLEQFFHEHGFHTRNMLLPGHGTRPGNLTNIDRQEWIKAVEFGVQSLHREIGGEVYIAGFSTGGALALRHALVHPECVDGLFLFAPSIQVPAQNFQLALKFFGFHWMPFQKLSDRDFASYESGSLDAAIEVSRLGNEVQALLEENTPDIPIMIVAAENDYSIKTDVTRTLFEDRKFGKKSKMLIYAPDAQLPPLSDTNSQYQPVYLNSRFVYTMAGNRYQIADYSHMALTMKPDDPHYGLAGNYRYCHHYFLWPGSAKSRERCSAAANSGICYGERKMIGADSYPADQNQSVVRRLTSNPKFDHLEQEMFRFIDQHISPQSQRSRER